MHGLINKAVQSFFIATYGEARWENVVRAAGLGFSEFEPMLIYDADQSATVLECIEVELDRAVSEFLEDLGTFLVSDPQFEALRRLLRFGGVTYEEFLHSLDDLPARTQLAVADLKLPKLELRAQSDHAYTLYCGAGLPGFGSVLLGVLRALADDYGALVTLQHRIGANGADVIDIALIETAFAAGRQFDLGARVG